MHRGRRPILVAQVHTPRRLPGAPLNRVAPRPAPDVVHGLLHTIPRAHLLALSAFDVFPLVVPRARRRVRTIPVGGRNLTEPLIIRRAAREHRGGGRLERGRCGGLKMACFQARQREEVVRWFRQGVIPRCWGIVVFGWYGRRGGGGPLVFACLIACLITELRLISFKLYVARTRSDTVMIDLAFFEQAGCSAV